MRKAQLILILIFCISQFVLGAELTLQEAQDLALKHNLALQMAQNKLEAGEAKYRGAQAGVYPKLNLSTSATKMKEQPGYMPGTMLPDKAYSLKVNLQQPIYPGMGLGEIPAIAAEQLEILTLEKEQAERELESQVAVAYFNALLAQEMVTVTTDAIEVAKVQLEKAQAFYDAGVVLKTDVLRAELAIGNLEQSLLAAKNGAALAWASLEATIGADLTGFQLVAFDFPQKQIQVSYEEALAFAFDHRAEFKLTAGGARQAALAVEYAKAGKRPQVALVGSYGWQGAELKFDDADWNVTISAQIPLFDGGSQNAKVEEAELGLEAANLGQKQLEQGIAMEVRQVHGALQEAKARLPLAQRAVEQADEALRIASARYREGLGLLTEVLEAQAAASKAKGDWVSALYQYYSAAAKFELALGAEIPEAWEEIR